MWDKRYESAQYPIAGLGSDSDYNLTVISLIDRTELILIVHNYSGGADLLTPPRVIMYN